ncbi:hypothetical protein ANTRET_LOCUS9642 [Anthophora retusa]
MITDIKPGSLPSSVRCKRQLGSIGRFSCYGSNLIVCTVVQVTSYGVKSGQFLRNLYRKEEKKEHCSTISIPWFKYQG